jgi:hypothetical protein
VTLNTADIAALFIDQVYALNTIGLKALSTAQTAAPRLYRPPSNNSPNQYIPPTTIAAGIVAKDSLISSQIIEPNEMFISVTTT